MRSSFFASWAFVVLSVAGCGSDATTDAAVGLDGGGGLDGSIADAAPADSGPRDGGLDAATADASTDAAADAPILDGGPPPDGPFACDPNLGAPCPDDVCPSGLECNIGRCTPQDREVCGGFAGAPCTDARYPHCLYFESADFGTCVTVPERSCLCERAPASFPECTASP